MQRCSGPALAAKRPATMDGGPTHDTESSMKLYYSPGACSLSPHIALVEAGAKFEAIKVGKDKQAEDGRDFRDINPFGYVPALVTDEGVTLLEGPAIVQYIADKFPAAKLAPPNGTMERYQLQSALGFINSEIHKTAGGLFKPNLTDEERNQVVDKLDTRFKQLAVWRNGKDWIANDEYSVADAYLFVVTRWLQKYLERWPWLESHFHRVKARPGVHQALVEEGLA
jgi:glutathione S-transferase